MNTIFRIYEIYSQISKNKILSNLLLVIPVTPYNLYVCASIISYLYLPDIIHQIIKHIAILSIGEIITNIISNKYICNKLFQWFDIIYKILTIGYILTDLQSFKFQLANTNTNNVYKDISLLVLELAISSTYYTFVFGSIATFALGLMYKVTIIYKTNILEIYEDIIKIYARIMLEYFSRPENEILRSIIYGYFGLNNQPNQPNHPNQQNLTIQQLNEIAPLRCIGFENTEQFELTSCSICLDEFNHRVLHRTLSCNHKFHPDCVDRWLLHSSMCPMCRNIIRFQT